MSPHSRRAFLKRLAAGAAYVAPVVVSVAAPPVLAAQHGKSSQHKQSPLRAAPTETRDVPFEAPPPGQAPPGTEPPGGRP